MQKFLIIQTAFIGDVVLSTPIISELYRLYPQSEIDVVVRKGNESLLENNPKINRILIWEKRKSKYSNLFKTVRAIRKAKYDEVITLQRYTSAGILTFFSKSKYKTGFADNTFKRMYSRILPHSLTSGSHEVERNLSLISHHGAKKLIRPELFPSESDYKSIEKYITKPFYCLAPASVWGTKKLPTEKWIELINLLLKRGEVYLIGGSSDFSLCEEIRGLTSPNVRNLAGKLSFLESAALMENATMNYVNDSAPLHIASAMNAPVRAFFCSTISQFGFGPLSDDSKVVETKKKLDCRPCTYHGRKKCPLKHYECGKSIDIHQDYIVY